MNFETIASIIALTISIGTILGGWLIKISHIDHLVEDVKNIKSEIEKMKDDISNIKERIAHIEGKANNE